MVTIEFKKIFKESIVILIIVIALLLAMEFTNKDQILAPILNIFLLLYASFLGWSMFDRERQEGALEYLLSLPISRTRLFAIKLLPRLAALGFFLGVAFILRQTTELPFILSPWQFTCFFVVIFFLSLSLSLSIKNFVITFFITALLPIGLYFLIKYLGFSFTSTEVALRAALILMIFPFFFVVFLQKFDLKPLISFNKRYLSFIAILVLLVAAISFIVNWTRWPDGFPTKKGFNLHFTVNKTVLIRGKDDKKVIKKRLWPVAEDGDLLYAIINPSGRGQPSRLISLDQKSAEIKALFDAQDGFWFHGVYSRNRIKGRGLYLLLTGPQHLEFQILEQIGENSRLIPVSGSFDGPEVHLLHHVFGDPLQFFVFDGAHIYRIFENGESERLMEADYFSFWKNRVLTFKKGKMTLYEVGDQVLKVFEKNGNIHKLRIKDEHKLSVQVKQRYVLLTDTDGFQIFDMKTQTLEPISMDVRPYFYMDTKDGVRIIWIKDNEISVSSWEEKRMVVEKNWFTSVKPLGRRNFIRFIVYPAGVVVFNGRQCEIFKFHQEQEVGRL